MRVFHFLFEVTPALGSGNFEACGGAFINCWIYAASESLAERRAGSAIKRDGWTIVALKEKFQTGRNDYLDRPESLELYDQAQETGEAYLTKTWPPEPQEDDVVQ